jgi:hypothetical protein
MQITVTKFFDQSNQFQKIYKVRSKIKNHHRRIFLDNLLSATLSSVKFGETCNFEVKCLLSVVFLGMFT